MKTNQRHTVAMGGNGHTVGRGLKLSEEYFEATKGRVSAAFPRLYPRMAIGLIGHGSQCLGFDDRLSQDHDWGPQYCVFLQPADYSRHGEKLQRFLKTLPTEFRGFRVQWDRRQPRERSGVLCLDNWVRQQLGVAAPFTDPTDWLRTSDPRLLWVTNGQLWHDPLGQLSRLRQRLAYYPEPVWRKKLANKCLMVEIAGPYQMHRAMERGDSFLPLLLRGDLVREALQISFLLNRRYAPISKWLLPAFLALPRPAGLSRPLLTALLQETEPARLLALAKLVSARLHRAVRQAVPAAPASRNIFALSFGLLDTIYDRRIRQMPFWDQEPVL